MIMREHAYTGLVVFSENITIGKNIAKVNDIGWNGMSGICSDISEF